MSNTGTPPTLTLGQRLADKVTSILGSWNFIVIQSLVLVTWIVINSTVKWDQFDPFPFILLNLCLSFQAAYAAPIIMMANNRQAEIDRARMIKDLDIDIESYQILGAINAKLDLLIGHEQ